jgi:hypothetical protein
MNSPDRTRTLLPDAVDFFPVVLDDNDHLIAGLEHGRQYTDEQRTKLCRGANQRPLNVLGVLGRWAVAMLMKQARRETSKS